VPVEAVLIPELEALVGVDEALADWQSGRVTVRHAASFEPAQAAAVLADFDYPATEWNTLASPGVATLD
jgi:hypothetical protein